MARLYRLSMGVFYCKIFKIRLKISDNHENKSTCQVYKTSSPGYFLWPTRPAAPYRGQSWMWGERALSTSSTNTLFDPLHRLSTHSHSYPSRRKNQLKRIRVLLWVSQRARSMSYVMQRTRQGFLSNTHTWTNVQWVQIIV